MKVLVTGGTGYVGSHAVAALVRHGHEVRLLVRSPDRVGPALQPLGLTGLEHTVGDVTDKGAVQRALGLRRRRARGVRLFVGHEGRAADARSECPRHPSHARCRAGEGPRPGDLHIELRGVATFERRRPDGRRSRRFIEGCLYCQSKADAERVARSFQEAGPVTIVYPGGVWGPHDPHLGDQLTRLRNILKLCYPMYPSGGSPIVDVRDVAEVIGRAVEPGRGPRRYMARGHTSTAPCSSRTSPGQREG